MVSSQKFRRVILIGADDGNISSESVFKYTILSCNRAPHGVMFMYLVIYIYLILSIRGYNSNGPAKCHPITYIIFLNWLIKFIFYLHLHSN